MGWRNGGHCEVESEKGRASPVARKEVATHDVIIERSILSRQVNERPTIREGPTNRGDRFTGCYHQLALLL